jgi:hypothetical protein
MEIIFFPIYALAILIEIPYLGLIPILLFAFLWHKTRLKLSLTTTILWSLYTLYELYMHFKCTGECNIRIDLLAMYPLLTGFTLVTLITLALRSRKKKTDQPDA